MTLLMRHSKKRSFVSLVVVFGFLFVSFCFICFCLCDHKFKVCGLPETRQGYSDMNMRKRRIRDEKKLGQHRRGPEQPREERSFRTTAAGGFDQLSHEDGSEHRSPISSAWGRGGEVWRDNFTHSVFSQSKGKPSAPNEAGSMESLETLGLEQSEQESTPVKLPRNPTWKGPHCHLRLDGTSFLIGFSTSQ